jgi:hypothetical protein
MGLKQGMWISLLLAGRSGSRDLTLGCTIWNFYGKELLRYDACFGEVWTKGGFTMAFFQGWGVRSEVLLEQVQLNFSFRNKFIILLPYGLIVDNNTFSKMCVFRILTDYTDYGGYIAKRDSAYTRIRVNDHIVASRSVFVHGYSPTVRFHPRPAVVTISFRFTLKNCELP